MHVPVYLTDCLRDIVITKPEYSNWAAVRSHHLERLPLLLLSILRP